MLYALRVLGVSLGNLTASFWCGGFLGQEELSKLVGAA